MLSKEDDSNWEVNVTCPNIEGSWVSFGEDISGELYIVSINGGIYKIIDAALSQNELTLNNVIIYPNPFDEFININLQETADIKIYDSFGKKIIQIDDFKGTQVDLRNLIRGIYFIKVDGYQIKKIIKK